MDIDNANPSVQPYTILRIKRKRNEEPLDALGKHCSFSRPDTTLIPVYLVVESGMPRKKSRAAMDIFQFAQTVEDDTWKDEARQRAIQVRNMWQPTISVLTVTFVPGSNISIIPRN